jgi:hypothetical protein
MRILPVLVLLAALALTAAGCGSSDKTRTRTTPIEPARTETTPTKITPMPAKQAHEAAYSDAQLTALFNATYAPLAKNATRHGNYFPRAAAGLRADSTVIAALAKRTLTQHPASAVVHVLGTQADYSDQSLASCTADLTINEVVDKEGRSLAIVMTTDKALAYLVYDYRRAGKPGFDKTGYANKSGSCTKGKVAPKALTSRDVHL